MWSNPFAFSRPGLGAAVPAHIPSSRPVMRLRGVPGARPPAFRWSGKETRGCAYAAPCPGGRTPGWTRGEKTTGWLTVFD